MSSMLPIYIQPDKSSKFYDACLLLKRITRLRKKSVVILTFTFFLLVCFGAMFFLPDLREFGLGSNVNFADQNKGHLVKDGIGVHSSQDLLKFKEKIKDQNIIKPPPDVNSVFSKKEEKFVDDETNKMRREKIVEVCEMKFLNYHKLFSKTMLKFTKCLTVFCEI